MNTMPRFAVVLLAGTILLPAKTGNAAIPDAATRTLVQGGVFGQLRFSKSQPKADPFAGQSNTVAPPSAAVLPARKQQALQLLQQGRSYLSRGDIAGAIQYHDRAAALRVPFHASEDKSNPCR